MKSQRGMNQKKRKKQKKKKVMRGRDQILTRKEKDDRESCSKDREKDGRSRLPVRLTH